MSKLSAWFNFAKRVWISLGVGWIALVVSVSSILRLDQAEEKSLMFDWSLLRAVEGYRVVKSMYVWLFIVPIAAKATAKIEGVATVKVFNYEFAVELGLPFSWEAFYFSAVAFVIGNIIIISRCPKIILDHPDYSSFKSQGKGNHQLMYYLNNIGKTIQQIDIYWELLSDRTPEDRLSGTFWWGHEEAQSYRPISRNICLTCYAVGFSLIAIVVLQNLKFVIEFSVS